MTIFLIAMLCLASFLLGGIIFGGIAYCLGRMEELLNIHQP